METEKTQKYYAVSPPGGFDEDFTKNNTLSLTKQGAWLKFCYPALNQKAYEDDGFKAVEVELDENLS